MKTPDTRLYKLIQSLTVGERRYFKRYYAQQTQLAELWDILVDAQEPYDEQAIKDSVRNKMIVKNFKAYKLQLQEKLLESLCAFHAQDQPLSQLFRSIEQAQLLIKKKQNQWAADLLERSKKTAYAYEEYEMALKIAVLQLRSLIYVGEDKLSSEALLGEIRRLNEGIDNYAVFQQAIDKMEQINIPASDAVMISSKDNSWREALRGFMEACLLGAGAPKPIFPVARRTFHVLLARCYWALGDYETLYEHCQQEVAIFEENPLIIPMRLGQYCTALGNLITASAFTGRYAQAQQVQLALEHLLQAHPHLYEIHVRALVGVMVAQKQRNRWDAALETYQSVIQPTFDQIENKAYFYWTLLHSFEMLLVLRQYKLAAKCLAILEQGQPTLASKGVFDCFVLMEMLYYLERADLPYLETYARSVLGRLQRHRHHKPFLEYVIRFMLALTDAAPKQYKALFAAHLEALGQFEQDKDWINFVNFFAYRHWLLAKIAGVEWRQYLAANPPDYAVNG